MMKKTASIFMAFLLALGLVGLAGCGTPDGTEGTEEQQSPSDSPENTPPYAEPDVQGTPSPSGSETDIDKNPALLAALETLDVSEAFGDTSSEDWSYGLHLSGGFDASYRFRWYSELSEEERYYALIGGGLTLDDTVGVRADETSPLGFDLFGGGNINISTRYTGPTSDSEPVEGSFDAGFRHDGDLIWYAGEHGEESIPLEEAAAYFEGVQRGIDGRIFEATATIPEDIRKGLSLRLAVEDLIDLGFTAELDDSAGVAIRLTATKGFYSTLLNNMLEELLPDTVLEYLPRVDFRYDETAFSILLTFDENGLFREYSVESSVALSLSFELRELFLCESGYTLKGKGSVTAVTAPPPAPEETV